MMMPTEPKTFWELVSLAEIKATPSVFHIKLKLDTSVLLLRDAQCHLGKYFRLLCEQTQEGESMATIDDLRALDHKIDDFIGLQDDAA